MRIVAALALVFIQTLCFADSPCELAVKAVAGANTSWRSAFTHPNPDGSFTKTNAQREKDIQTSLQLQLNEIQGNNKHGESDTPPMIVVPTSDTKITFTKKWEEYGTMYAKVTGAKDGFIHATVLLPVSAHTGLADARTWSTTDTYTLTIQEGSDKEVPLISTSSKSLDLVTAQEVKIPVQHGKKVTLRYYRNYPSLRGGGPGGFAGGRELVLSFDKNEVDNTPTDFTQQFWD